MKSVLIATALTGISLAAGVEIGKHSTAETYKRGAFVLHERGAQMNFTVLKDGKPAGEKPVFFGDSNKGVTTVGTVADKDLPKSVRQCLEAYRAGEFDALATAPFTQRPKP